MERLDAELVEAACHGDLASFRELYQRHYRLAVGIARSRLSDVHLAEDAAQEAFAVACKRLSLLRNGARFPEWLGTICRRTADKMARSRKNYLQLGEVAASPPNPSGEEEAAAHIRAAVEKLARSVREVVLLHYFSGLSYEEIGRALGITAQAVHGRLQRARRTLAQVLSKEFESESSR